MEKPNEVFLQRIRDFCGNESCKGKDVQINCLMSEFEMLEDWKAELAAMSHFAEINGATAIIFIDDSVILQSSKS